MAEKSEAQLRNEEEVRRILEARGYASLSDEKPSSRGVSLKPLIIILFIAALGIGGWFFLQTNPFGGEQSSPKNNIRQSKSGEEYYALQTCLRAADIANVELDDPEFWDKYIAHYEQSIACYDQSPAYSDSSSKADLEQKLTAAKENKNLAEANNAEYLAKAAELRRQQAENEKKYQETIAKNQAEYEKQKAELDAETEKKLAEYDKQRAERDAQYAKEKEEREAKQAKCDAFQKEYPDVASYKSKRGNLDELWNKYQEAKTAYESAVRSYGSSNPNHSDEWRAAIWKGVEEKKAIMDNAHNLWSQTDTNLANSYNSGYREACL